MKIVTLKNVQGDMGYWNSPWRLHDYAELRVRQAVEREGDNVSEPVQTAAKLLLMIVQKQSCSMSIVLDSAIVAQAYELLSKWVFGVFFDIDQFIEEYGGQAFRLSSCDLTVSCEIPYIALKMNSHLEILCPDIEKRLRNHIGGALEANADPRQLSTTISNALGPHAICQKWNQTPNFYEESGTYRLAAAFLEAVYRVPASLFTPLLAPPTSPVAYQDPCIAVGIGLEMYSTRVLKYPLDFL